MSKKVPLILLTCLFMLLYACGGPKIITIGVIVDLSGPTKEYGKSLKQGIELAAARVNNDPAMREQFLGGFSLELKYFDSKGTKKGAKLAFLKLNREGISILIGPMSSHAAIAVAPLAQKSETLMLTPTASTPNLSKVGGDFVMRNTSSDIIEAIKMSEACKKIGFRNVAILFQVNEYSTQWASAFRTKFKERKGEISKQRSFKGTEDDFSEVIDKTVSGDPDAILLVGYYEPCSKIIKQIRELETYYPILGPGSFYNQNFHDLIKDYGAGIMFTFPDYDPKSTKPIVKQFVQEYQAKYNNVPDIFAASAYDSVILLVHAFKRAGSPSVTSGDLRDNLVKIQNFPGVSGETSFDKRGECIKPPKLGVLLEDGSIMRVLIDDDESIQKYKDLIDSYSKQPGEETEAEATEK